MNVTTPATRERASLQGGFKIIGGVRLGVFL
jgi:hypothetical protein